LDLAPEMAVDPSGKCFKAHQVLYPCAIRVKVAVLHKLGFGQQTQARSGYSYLQVRLLLSVLSWTNFGILRRHLPESFHTTIKCFGWNYGRQPGPSTYV